MAAEVVQLTKHGQSNSAEVPWEEAKCKLEQAFSCFPGFRVVRLDAGAAKWKVKWYRQVLASCLEGAGRDGFLGGCATGVLAVLKRTDCACQRAR